MLQKPTTKPPRELFHIGGDDPRKIAAQEPDRPLAGPLSSTSHISLDANIKARPKILWKRPDGAEFLITADYYHFDGELPKLILLCPMCSKDGEVHALSVDRKNKAFDLDPAKDFVLCRGDNNEALLAGGRLDVPEPIACTWELDTHRAVDQGSMHIVGGNNRCPWKVVIERNIARDVR